MVRVCMAEGSSKLVIIQTPHVGGCAGAFTVVLVCSGCCHV